MAVLLDVVISLAIAWLAFVVILLCLRPPGVSLREVVRVAPDLARLVSDLSRDPTVPRAVRRRLVILLAYLASPLDLIPDFIPVVGYADDVILIGIILRSAVRRAGPLPLEQHWRGTPAGLDLVRRVIGIA